MDRRSFLGSLVAAIAALLLPKHEVLGEVTSSLEEHALGLDEPRADEVWLKTLSSDVYTGDGGHTWEAADIGSTWFVGQWGNDANDGLAPDTPFLTLSAALAKTAKDQLEADIVIVLGNAKP